MASGLLIQNHMHPLLELFLLKQPYLLFKIHFLFIGIKLL